MDEPTCPLCDSVLSLHVDHATELRYPTVPLTTAWRVVCDENDHVILTSWEYLERWWEAHDEDEPVAANWWWEGNPGDDETQPIPDPAQLLATLSERT